LNSSFIQTLLKTYDDNFEFPYDKLNTFSIADLLNYLKQTHRFYLYKKLPEIEQTILQLFNNYKDTHKLLVLLCYYFVDFKKKLVDHIQYEEKTLFPYIQKLINLNQETNSAAEIKAVLNSFSAKMFLQTHSDIEDDLQIVRKTILEFTPSDNTPLPYRVFLSQLHHFEIDLCKHAMIEDNVLINKVLDLEEMWKHEAMNVISK
jgi:regulator of cell morphogenesis and NO signaling